MPMHKIIRNGRGDVLGLYPLMPDKMKVDRDEKNRLIYIYSRYDEANPNLKEQGDIVLYADEVLHIPGLGFDGWWDIRRLHLQKNAIGISIACEEYGASFFWKRCFTKWRVRTPRSDQKSGACA